MTQQEVAPLAGKTALVTGGGGGIGRALCAALLHAGAEVFAAGRTVEPLEAAARSLGPGLRAVQCDLADPTQIARLAETIRNRCGGLDILAFSSGLYASGPMAGADVAEFERLLRVNVLGPYALLQQLLDGLKTRRGQVVFVNSSIVHAAAITGRGQYAASQHALRAVADSLRDEVNVDGVRVISVYPGRTATPRQAAIHNGEGRPYRPENLLQPEDVASAILAALVQPDTAEITDIRIRPMRK
ncbi:MAG: SDR family NAD(P)-dependent oxidoreductase [Caulobacteraceae bacterium]